MATNQQHVLNLLKYPMPIIPSPPDLANPQVLAKYLHELNRTIEENLRKLFITVGGLELVELTGGGGSDFYICTVLSSASGTGKYNCKVEKYNRTTEVLETIHTTKEVTDLIDASHVEETLLVGDEIIAWKISLSSDSTPEYFGIQYFGRSTIGLP